MISRSAVISQKCQVCGPCKKHVFFWIFGWESRDRSRKRTNPWKNPSWRKRKKHSWKNIVFFRILFSWMIIPEKTWTYNALAKTVWVKFGMDHFSTIFRKFEGYKIVIKTANVFCKKCKILPIFWKF